MTTPKYDLPTAIRIGAKIRPQGFGFFLSPDGKKTCVLGAAVEAEGVDWKESECPLPEDFWPELFMKIDGEATLFEVVRDLNDLARWTREEIADWVDMVLP